MNILVRIYKGLVYGNRGTLVLRLIVGLVFVYAGLMKVSDPEEMGRVIMQYDILPDLMVPYGAIILPWLEIFAGLLLVVGYRVRSAAFIILVLMAAFTFGITVNLIQGNTFNCGCFSFDKLGLGIDESLSWKLILRNLIIALAAIPLMFAERHLFSIEYLIEEKDLVDLE